MHLVPSASKFLSNHCLGFLLGRLLYPGEIGNNGYVKLWGGGEQGAYNYCLGENGELSDLRQLEVRPFPLNKPVRFHIFIFVCRRFT